MVGIFESNIYKKYKHFIDEGLILVPDEKMLDLNYDVECAYKDKPLMLQGETHEVMLKAGKKVRITSRGSLRDIEIDGVTYDSIDQAACSMYDPYDAYYEIDWEVDHNMADYTFIPIIDHKFEVVRYTISKYSKGLRKYFDPHKVVKCVYSYTNILFYVKDKKDVLRKYCFRYGAINIRDLLPYMCKCIAEKRGPEEVFYIAFFVHQEDLPFTVGGCKEDFYALKDILNKVTFKGTTPLKYMLFRELSDSEPKYLKTKETIAFNTAMLLTNKTKSSLCKSLDITEADYDEMMEKELLEISNQKGKKISRKIISKFLNLKDNLFELKYYESMNLMWRVKYNDIPNKI